MQAIWKFKWAAYLATDAEVFVFLAVHPCDLLYELRIFTVAHMIGVILNLDIRDSGALALAGEDGSCIQGSEPLDFLVGAHGLRSFGGASGCAGPAVLWCEGEKVRSNSGNLYLVARCGEIIFP